MTRCFVRLARLLTLPALLAAGMLTTPAVSAGNPCFHGYTMPPSTTGPGSDIKLLPCAFVPTVTVIGEGESVNFINGPDLTHLITGAAQEWGSPDIEIQPNQTVTHTFDEAGIYPYACALHSGMSGAIVVGDLEDAVAVGAAGSTTTGGSTDTTSGAAGGASRGETSVSGSDTSDASDATTANSATETTTVGTIALVGLGAGAGLVVGAAVVWLALRRRSEAHGMLASAK